MVSPGTTTSSQSNSPRLDAEAVGQGVPRFRAITLALPRWFPAIEWLWVSGLAVLCLFTGHVLLRFPGLGVPQRLYEWALYVVLGLAFPALLSAMIWWRQTRPSPTRDAVGKAALTLVVVIAGGALVVASGSITVIAATIVQLIIVFALMQRVGPTRPYSLLVGGFVVALISWSVAARFLWWESLDSILTRSAFAFIGGVLALVLGCWSLTTQVRQSRPHSHQRAWLLNAFGVGIIALMSLRQDGLFAGLFELLGDGGPMHHWGVYVGTAELVRQGGWLYWDVPSQYGFLNVLALLLVPTDTAWQALYLFNTAALFLSGVFIFFILRTLDPGLLNWCFSLAVTLSAVFLLTTWPPELLPTHLFPSAGSYRYVWCFALLAILLWEFRVDEGSNAQRSLLFVGSVLWLCGVLWSTESAFYCSAIWVPAYIAIVIRRSTIRVEMQRSFNRFWTCVGWLAVPVILVFSTIAAVVAYYLVRLGHPPDWRAPLEYIISFGDGSVSRLVGEMLTIDSSSTVLGLILVFCGVVTSAIVVLSAGHSARPLSLFLALAGAVWATSSYAIARPHPSTAFRIVPFIIIALIITLQLLIRFAPGSNWILLFRMSAIPVVATFLAMVFGNDLALARHATALLTGAATPTPVESRLPTVEPSLQDLFEEAGVSADEPLIYAGNDAGNLMPAWPIEPGDEARTSIARGWLPTMPFTLLIPLSDERKALYLERFADRAKLSGWFVQRKANDELVVTEYGAGPWFFAQVNETHIPTRVYENAHWQLTWFDYVGNDPTVVRPPIPDTGLGGLSPSLLVDGHPLGEAVDAETWAFLGAGWVPGAGAPEGFAGTLPAELWVYSPDTQRVQLRLTADATPGRATTFSVAANGKVSPALRLKTGAKVDAAVELNAGWNRVEFAPAESKRAAERGRIGSDQLGLATIEIETEAYDAIDATGRSR